MQDEYDMQFESEESNNNTTNEIITRLDRIENLLVSFNAQNDLIQELIRKEIRNNTAVCSLSQNESRPLAFTVTTVFTLDKTPVIIRINGRTYDIRDKIKSFGAQWKVELKAWEVSYNTELYTQILDYLQTLTTDIQQQSITENL